MRLESLSNIFDNCSNRLDNFDNASLFPEKLRRRKNDQIGKTDEKGKSFHGHWNVVDDHSLLLRLHSDATGSC